MARCLECQDPGVVATVFQAEGGLAAAFGRRLLLDEEGTRDNLPAALRDVLLEAAHQERERLLTEASPVATGRTQTFQIGETTVHVLLEPVLPPVPLVIFGAGNDAAPLAALALSLGWSVTLVDHRAPYADPTRFPGARVLALDYDEAFDHLKFTRRTLALTMTHNYLHDLHILKRLAGCPVAYLGVLGPRKRTRRLLADLEKDAAVRAPGFDERFFSPVGLDIGAETPEEVALSVLAEMQAVLAGRTGGFLRERKGAIHER
jgi:xanthine/CO dehydrogenase XdhC/CoxF family maturation factor